MDQNLKVLSLARLLQREKGRKGERETIYDHLGHWPISGASIEQLSALKRIETCACALSLVPELEGSLQRTVGCLRFFLFLKRG